MADALGGEEARRALTPEERRRNVRRVKEADEALEVFHARLVEIVYWASRMDVELARIRNEIRAAIEMDPLPLPPPIAEQIIAAGREAGREE